MHLFRIIYLRKFLSLFLMMAILNVVIDPPDLLKNIDADAALEEDLSLNEMESVIEVVVEQALDLENAIPETDDQETEDLCKKTEIMEFLEVLVPDFDQPVFYSETDHQTHFTDYFSLVTLLIDSPPPRV